MAITIYAKKMMTSSITRAAFSTVLLCILFACTPGKEPNVQKEYLQIFYKDGVTQPTAQKMLEFLYPLWRNDGAATPAKTVQLTKTGDTVNFRMVMAAEKVSTVTPENLGSFIQLMSDSVFNGSPVNVVLCDDHFREHKTLRYSEEFRKGAVNREANNQQMFGNRYRAGTAEVYAQPGVNEALGNTLAKYLDESNGTGEVHASFQVLKEGNGYVVKMATSPEFAAQHPDSVFVNMANMLSRDVFDGDQVAFVLSDLMFKDMKKFESVKE